MNIYDLMFLGMNVSIRHTETNKLYRVNTMIRYLHLRRVKPSLPRPRYFL